MEITLKEIQQKFIDILNDKISLEDANDWAWMLMQENESDNLIYVPPEHRDQIWEGIRYLNGIDIQVAPGEYLYGKEDVQEAYMKIFDSATEKKNYKSIKIEITLKEIKQKFLDVLNNKISLKDAKDWAWMLMQENNVGNLIYIPSEDESKIWEGIMYLFVIDLQKPSGEHDKNKAILFFKEEFESHKKKIINQYN